MARSLAISNGDSDDPAARLQSNIDESTSAAGVMPMSEQAMGSVQNMQQTEMVQSLSSEARMEVPSPPQSPPEEGITDGTKNASSALERLTLQQQEASTTVLPSPKERSSKAQPSEARMQEIKFQQVVLAARLQKKKQELGWRSSCEYATRSCLAWIFNFVLLLFFCFVSVVYALKFEEKATSNMILTWIIAYGVTFAIIEPIQVCLLVCAPCLWNEDTRCGRCCLNCRYSQATTLSYTT